MRYFQGLFITSTMGLLLAGANGFRPAQDAAWRADWQQARMEAKQAGKPLFVVFR